MHRRDAIAMSGGKMRTTVLAAVVTLALVAVLALKESSRAGAPMATHRRAVFVGLVMPRHARPGERVSVRMVGDPEDYRDKVKELDVVTTEVEMPVDEAGHPSFDKVVVDMGDGRKQPATRAITLNVPREGESVPVAIGVSGYPSRTKHFAVPIEPLREHARPPLTYKMQEICPESGVVPIHGPFDGNAQDTTVMVGGERAMVLVETFDAAYFVVPANARNGRNRVILRKGGREVSFDLFIPEIAITTDRPVLEPGQTAHFKVKLSKLRGARPEAWRAGTPSDVTNTIARAAPGFSPPAPGEPGKLLLTIENKSRAIVSMAPRDVIAIPVSENEAERGTFEYDGVVTARQRGTYVLEATVQPFTAECDGVETPVREVARNENTPTPSGENTAVTESTPPVEIPPVTETAPRVEKTPSNKTTQTETTPLVEETPVEHRELGPPVVYVPGVPVAVAPKCCVITSITVRNNEDYPVFFVLNGKYQAGMSPPPDEWVQPGQSGTFKGDFGECVRIEAFNNRSFDESGNPLTGLFDDERVCCEDLVSGKAKGERFSFTINSVEWRDWKDCPEKPVVPVAPPPVNKPTPTPTPTRTPTPTPTPTETPTPTPTPTETPTETPSPTPTPTPIGVAPPPTETEIDCPQRGKKCAALIIDLSENTHWWEASFAELEPLLGSLGICEVDKAYPEFWVYNQWVVVSVFGHKATYHTSPEQQAAAGTHNAAEWATVRAAIAAHRAKLRDGREMGIELVNGHGGPGAPGCQGTCAVSSSGCGSWGTDFYTGPAEYTTSFTRSEFHKSNYRAANHRVCDWFVYDASCFAGQTPMAIDELENTGSATCSGASVVSCPLHAGWEADLAGGVEVATEPSTNGRVAINAQQLAEVLHGEIADTYVSHRDYKRLAGKLRKWLLGEGVSGIINGGSSASYYTDKGYHDDSPPPPRHPHQGY